MLLGIFKKKKPPTPPKGLFQFMCVLMWKYSKLLHYCSSVNTVSPPVKCQHPSFYLSSRAGEAGGLSHHLNPSRRWETERQRWGMKTWCPLRGELNEMWSYSPSCLLKKGYLIETKHLTWVCESSMWSAGSRRLMEEAFLCLPEISSQASQLFNSFYPGK